MCSTGFTRLRTRIVISSGSPSLVSQEAVHEGKLKYERVRADVLHEDFDVAGNKAPAARSRADCDVERAHDLARGE